ncbi:hypothetical protein SNOG_09972 [Parastagonospora nodorum SN15]|uniref:Translation initiation factor eIF4e n=1 Tax=Phaeosphaeria nodorum (strain SN15 / ATCC MYA-4574 / FGSC 10173) TaxID=321614 RepID=Q0UE42_PHANO|nr:hypothetical protein SNOG_09972 [Parastagonospora nodorum SN15]EAT82307.2 hypothetical protein SNOG_09972 [Parastagonospora nodorum SN15]
MSEVARLYGLLEASAARNAYHNKALAEDFSSYGPSRKQTKAVDTANPCASVSRNLLEALQEATKHGFPKRRAPPSAEVSAGVKRIIDLLKVPSVLAPRIQSKETTGDLTNDVAVKNCKRILAARSNAAELKIIAKSLGATIPSPAMAGRFPQKSSRQPPRRARGTAMLNSIFKSVRVPEFRHKWMFWAEKGQQATPKDKSASSEEYASRPKPLGDQIISVKEFYQHFNNIPVESLKLRDSIHLFHLGVKPVWEDPRNTRGGAWYFKIPKDVAAQFWHEMCLLAVGDGLQGAVETKRASFNDDICGISYSVRWNAVQIAVWNRDAENEAGKEKLLKVILEQLSDELVPKKEDSYWYKAHKEHKGFMEQ